MAKIRLTKEFKFEMAHALLGYDGACSNIHGHSYVFYVTVIGVLSNNQQSPKDGMVMDYAILKKIVTKTIIDRLDHALLLNERTPAEHVAHMQQHYQNIILVPYQPTCENMLCDFAERLKINLPEGVSIHSMKLCETDTSFAEWFAEDNK